MSVDPTGWSIARYAEEYAGGTSPVAVIEAVLSALDHAPAGVLIGAPLRESAVADAQRLVGVRPDGLPLYGVPFVAKDNIDVVGVPTTAGCPGFSYTPEHDAAVIAILREAGAIVVAKANLDQFATGLVGTRSPYGAPVNTLDPELVPGGSSSGSAVAVALGLVPFSLGTDTAGSGRVPAALNGIVGVKPTLGSVSTRGFVPAVRRIDCPSVFARSPADAALVGTVIRRQDPLDAFSRAAPPGASTMRTVPVVGIPAAWPASLELAPEMAAWFTAACSAFAGLPVEVVPVDISPLLDVGSMLYGSALVAERAAAVGDAVAKGIDGLDPIVTGIISRAAEMSAVDAYRTEYELVRLRHVARSIWERIDVLALPTTPMIATLADVGLDPLGTNERLGRFTTFANLLDLASIVVPVPSTSPLPGAALQLLAPAWSDDDLAAMATALTTGTLDRSTQPCTLVVVGAHLAGLALHHQLTNRRATLVRVDATAPAYRLFALANTEPAKPGLVRVTDASPVQGAAIAVEVWSMGEAEFATFVQAVPPPLCIGTVELSDGSRHKGFLCEPHGLAGAVDITDFGGWRNYLAMKA